MLELAKEPTGIGNPKHRCLIMKDEISRALNGERRALARVLSAIENRTYSIETVGAKLRAMMPWIGKKKLVDSDKQ